MMETHCIINKIFTTISFIAILPLLPQLGTITVKLCNGVRIGTTARTKIESVRSRTMSEKGEFEGQKPFALDLLVGHLLLKDDCIHYC